MIEMKDCEAERQKRKEQEEKEKEIENDKCRAYDALVILTAMRDTYCPYWLEDKINEIINELWERVGKKVVYDFSE